MAWIATIFYKNRRFISFILAIVIFSMIVLSPGQIRLFIGNISASILYLPFSELNNYISELSIVTEENRHLRLQITEASLQLSAQGEAIRENSRLREFLGFDPPEKFKVVPIKIVSLLQNIYPVAAIVNKGSNDSIFVDQPVINRFGLVGKIAEVMPDFSNVTLLTDPSNPVSGRVADSRQIGIVRFSPEDGMYFDNLPADALFNAGDLIITSGLGGVYPAGLSIAMIDSAAAEKGDILKSIWLTPTVNFFEIDELYVLISEGK
jgi:rod shape-determining protein MreC